ncbi:hypothetical protein [Pantoea agglomerans]|uniref:hypothetical protein n=1 Tax=Enterobacter agglomerans TaxID=549 RepID=UPI003BF58AA8
MINIDIVSEIGFNPLDQIVDVLFFNGLTEHDGDLRRGLGLGFQLQKDNKNRKSV